MACSIPPMYWSTGIQWRATTGSKGRSGVHGSVNRRKYQDESTKVSMVSVSRVAGPPHTGQVVLRNSWLVARGDSPVGWNSVSYTHLRAHETVLELVCRLLLEKKK